MCRYVFRYVDVNIVRKHKIDISSLLNRDSVSIFDNVRNVRYVSVRGKRLCFK